MLNKIKKKYEYVLDAFLSVCQADRPKKGRQWLELDTDDASYTDGKKIHVGLNTIPWNGPFEDEEDEEFQRVVLAQYLLEHEDQHNRSTRNKDYEAAIERSFQTLLEQMSLLRKDGFVFRKIDDYPRYLEELQKQNVYLNEQMARYFCQGIVNALEDGRIERIRSVKRPGFNQKMVYVRAKYWLDDDFIENIKEDYDDIEADTKFLLIINNILTLATMRVYQKSFFDRFNGTEVFNTVNAIRPFIKQAVMSGKCRGLVRASTEIMKVIAQYLLDIAVTNKTSQAQSMMQKMMKDTGMEGEKKSNYTCKASNEEESEDGEDAGNPMGRSDLDGDDKDSASKSDEDGDSKKNSSSLASDDQTESDEDTDMEGQSPLNASVASANDNGKDSKKGKSSSDENSGQDSNVDDGEGTLPDQDFSRGQRGHGKDGNIADTLKDIMEAMKKAAESMQGDFKAMKNQATRNVDKNFINKTDEDVPPYTPQDDKLKKRFKELKRAYALNEMMPFALQNRSDKFAEDVDELFANQEIPLVRCQKNGSIDASNIYKLGINSIDCFSKEMEVPEFDGAAYILIDNSGSMGYGHGSNRFYACNGVAVIEAGFSKHMPLKITAFDDSGTVYHEVIKDWEEELGCSGAYNFMRKGRKGGGTPTAEAVTVATEELMARNCDSRMLIIVTDGEPNDESKCKYAIEQAREKAIEVITIFYDEYASLIQEYREDGNNKRADELENMSKNNMARRRKIFGKNSIFCAPEDSEKELASLMQTFVFG